MTKIHCNAEIVADGQVMICKFRGEDGCCTKGEIEVGEDEGVLATCYDVEWIVKNPTNSK